MIDPLQVLSFLHFKPSLDASSIGSDVIGSIILFSWVRRPKFNNSRLFRCSVAGAVDQGGTRKQSHMKTKSSNVFWTLKFTTQHVVYKICIADFL